MKSSVISVLISTLFLLCGEAVAQNLPTLPKASEIAVGTLPCKVSWYVVTNPSYKGHADFALVRKGAPQDPSCREDLIDLPHFRGMSPAVWLSSKGVGYDESGFISKNGEGTVFRFQDVPIFDSVASDSTLLMLFDLASVWNGEQAIIISGDVAAAKYPDRMKVMSMMVNARGKSPAAKPYIWNPTDSLLVRFLDRPQGKLAAIRVEYRAPRTEPSKMNTPLPLVTRMFARELSTIVRKRVGDEFRKAGIPLAGFSMRHLDSSASPSDEVFTFRVTTSADRLPDATAALAKILAHIDVQGVSRDELSDARERVASAAAREAGNRVLTNREYTDKCVASYLYGASLCSVETENSFLARRSIDTEEEIGMFSRFASALISANENVTLTFESPNATPQERDALEKAFRQSWEWAKIDTLAKDDHRIGFADTTALLMPEAKVKFLRSVPEPITGGEMWTFSNGMRVVWKKTAMKGEFRYAFMVKGGCSGIEGLLPGENAFVGDMLRLYDIQGMRGVDFRGMLRANGIEMTPNVSLSEIDITGTAPSDRLQLLMKSILAISNRRLLNLKEFDYFKASEELRLEDERYSDSSIKAVMDSIMCPEYMYPDNKSMSSLLDDLPQRSEAFFEKQFGNWSDGVVVLAGDLDAARTKKILCETLGGFRTTKARSPRPAVNCPLRTGTSTYTFDAPSPENVSVSLALSAQIPYSMGRYMAFEIAKEVLRKKIVRELQPMGMYASVSEKVEFYPMEKMTLHVICRPCREDGLPSGVSPQDPLTTLGALRSALNSLSGAKLSAAELKGYKAALTNTMTSRVADTDFLVGAALARYSDGRDLVSDYKGRINAVTEADVSEILNGLLGGTRVEYVLK